VTAAKSGTADLFGVAVHFYGRISTMLPDLLRYVAVVLCHRAGARRTLIFDDTEHDEFSRWLASCPNINAIHYLACAPLALPNDGLCGLYGLILCRASGKHGHK